MVSRVTVVDETRFCPADFDPPPLGDLPGFFRLSSGKLPKSRQPRFIR